MLTDLTRHHALAGGTPSRPVGVARVLVGAAAVAKAFDLIPIVQTVLQPGVYRMPYLEWLPLITHQVALLAIAVWVVAGFAFTLGWKTRTAGCLLLAAIGVVFVADQQNYGNHLYLLLILVFLMTVADSGAAVSLDARGKEARHRIVAWPVTLLKLQLSIVYGFAAVAKLQPLYLSGIVMNAALPWEGPLALPLALRRWEVLVPLSITSLLLELFLAFGLWSRRLRPAAILLGVGMHVVITFALGSRLQLAIFSALMFSMYVLFPEPHEWQRLQQSVSPRPARRQQTRLEDFVGRAES